MDHSTESTLSLRQAILINVNIMLGAGVFINTVLLSQQAGALGGLAYVIVGGLMLPLIMSIAQLLDLYPGGGFYEFGAKALSPFFGFVSSWSYFTGKLGSCALGAHVFTSLMQQLFPALQALPTVPFDVLLLILFAILNLLNIKTGTRIQATFLFLKLIPLTFVGLVGIWLVNGSNLGSLHHLWHGLPSAIPFALFAFMGFEATCSLSSKIENPKKNGPKALLISYALVIAIAVLYQTLFYGDLGASMFGIENYLGAFPALIKKLLPFAVVTRQALIGIMHVGIAVSALGAAYGIMFSNTWNLYTLARNNLTFFAQKITLLNTHQIPTWCIIIQAIISITYLILTRGNQIPLQQLSALACTTSYSLSVFALLWATLRKKTNSSLWLPLLGSLNCLVLIGFCLRNFILTAPYMLLVFVGILGAGTAMFVIKRTLQPAE